MTDGRGVAALTSGLLARKGQARPAMRPQGTGGQGGPDDLGWNDFGSADATAGPLPEVLRQQRALEAELKAAVVAIIAEEPEEAPPVVPVSRTTKATSAFTLRVDAARHLRLRLACAMQRRSAQNIVTEALDRFLGSVPGLEALAATTPRAGGAPAADPE